MKQRLMKLTACFLAAGMTFAGTGTIVFADNENTAVEADAEAEQEAAEMVDEADGEKAEETEAVDSEEVKEDPEEAPASEASEDLTGQLTFAQCEEYINVRSGASTDSEVVAKIYNNDSATIIGQEGDWFKIQSGNAVGYVKAEYFATGEAAEAIAQEVAYNVAVVHPDELNIRSSADTESEPVGVAYSSEELEVVDYQGDWMKVALGGDVYGYVNAYYVDYKTYYPTAETLEEEQARMEAEQYQAEDPVYDDWSADAQAEADAAYEAQAEAEYQAYLEAQAAEAAQAEADAAYQQYLDAQAAADNSQAEAEAEAAQAQAEAEYQAYLEAQAAAEAQAQAEAEAAAKAQAEAEAAAAAKAAAEAAKAEAEANAAAPEQPATEASSSEPEYTETSCSSTGQDIANYALQFVGNPYVWGGTSLTNGADCSGFVQSVFANFGIGLPRVAADQAGSGTSVDLSSIQAGDLLFYSGSGSGIDHVAIYIGGGSIVHASNPTSGITTSGAYYSTPVAAVRCW